MKKIVLPFVFLSFLYLSSVSQQITTPAPSPPQSVKQDFGLSSIGLSYSRPGIKGRKIFGDLVPYGKVWRTGANSATTLTFGDDVIIGGTKIPAGKYGLLTIPGAEEWTIIITKQLDVTSPAAYKQDQDVVRVAAHANELPFPLENFTILFANITSNTCDLQLIWDKTFVSFPIKTEIDTGDPADAILTVAERDQSDMIILGGRGFSTVRRFLMGSVSSKVSTHATCAVLIVHPKMGIAQGVTETAQQHVTA